MNLHLKNIVLIFLVVVFVGVIGIILISSLVDHYGSSDVDPGGGVVGPPRIPVSSLSEILKGKNGVVLISTDAVAYVSIWGERKEQGTEYMLIESNLEQKIESEFEKCDSLCENVKIVKYIEMDEVDNFFPFNPSSASKILKIIFYSKSVPSEDLILDGNKEFRILDSRYDALSEQRIIREKIKKCGIACENIIIEEK